MALVPRLLLRQCQRSTDSFKGFLQLSPAAYHAGHITCRTRTRPVLLTTQLQRCWYSNKDDPKSPLNRSNVSKTTTTNTAPDGQQFSTATQLQLSSDDSQQSTDLITKVNESVQSPEVGRMFAVVHIKGKQRKVTVGDILVVSGMMHCNIGDRIKLEKVLMAGNKDFTLVGRPLLSRNLVNVEATVIEKTLSHVIISFDYIAKERFRKMRLRQIKQTMLVINCIDLKPLSEGENVF